jgi:hypothetical protein
MKKNQTQSEMQWRKDRSDERWEKRADYLMGFFSQVTTSLPRQMSHQNSINDSSKVVVHQGPRHT